MPHVHKRVIGFQQHTEPAPASKENSFCAASGDNGFSLPGKTFSSLKCDKIQYPPSGPFLSEALNWSHGKKRQAWILDNRVEDFIQGENRRQDFNTRFFMQKSNVRRKSGCGSLVAYVRRYHCHYGPKDFRPKVKSELPEDMKGFRKMKTITGESVRRGCRACFSITYFPECEGAALITWHHKAHVDSSGRVCHGLLDPTAPPFKAHVAKFISKSLKLFIERMVRAGLTNNSVVIAHQKEIVSKWRRLHPNDDDITIWTRDMQLCPKDIQNVREAVNMMRHNFSSDDATATKIWVDNNPDEVLFYQEKIKSIDQPFMLMWATPWQQKKMVRLRHGNAVAMDATFGTNQYAYPFYTFVVFDQFQNAIPIAFATVERCKAIDLIPILNALKVKANEKIVTDVNITSSWTPSCWIVDCADEEQIAISAVFPDVPITFCTYHVRRVWTKNIDIKVFCPFAKALINRELAKILYAHDNDDIVAMSKAFMEKWELCQPYFVKYYRDE
ncbi:unnamed protein product [Calypogeia fissa]